MDSSDQMLMRSQMAAEFELAHRAPQWPPWQTGNPPPHPQTYLISTETIDGAPYFTTAYWHEGWRNVPHWQPVRGWMVGPAPLRSSAM